ncbi:MAG: protein DpdH [Candidatus Acidiferrales bacterium]
MTPFRGYVCWKEDRIESVLNPDALQTSDAVFLATHHPMTMLRDSSLPYDERSFLEEFLKPRDYAFVPVLGEAGIGKSHLIRWLSVQIRPTSKRKVILVRKAATNLREIIRLIIHDAKGKIFEEYRSQLDAASSDLASPEYAREKFLDNLALETSRTCARGLPPKMNEELGFVVDRLPALLRDAVFRKILLRQGNVIERLTNHVFGKSNRVQRLDERRQFIDDDLPVKVTDVPEYRRAGADARDLFDAFLSHPPLRKVAIAWLNASLNDALASLLLLRNNRLFELMLELRRQLAEDDIELVLLIEDMAMLQGVDQQLMEALLVRREQGQQGRLCALRTALACTTGYYQSLEETVRHRMNFTVTLDAPGFKPSPSELAAFGARYLNALRLSEKQLNEWLDRVATHGDTRISVPSACEHCPHRERCLPAFGTGGAVAPFGLYPFTETALVRMEDRDEPERSTSDFNPRLFIKHVLQAVLDHYTQDFRNGSFPPPEMRQMFRRTSLSRLSGLDASVSFEIQRRDKKNADRREVFLDLWTQGDRLLNLDPVIHEAFDLPELSQVKSEERPSEQIPEPAMTKSKKAVPDALGKTFDEINRWVSGDVKMSFDLANELRPILFGCLVQYFPWDTEFVLSAHYKEFRATSIELPNQQSLAAPSKIRIRVPGNSGDRESMSEIGVLLQGLLRFDSAKGWNFSGAERTQRLLAKYLNDWAGQLRDQIRSLEDSKRNPVPAGVEVLAIGAKLAGKIGPGASDEAAVGSMFGSVEMEDAPDRSPKWQKLVQEFLSRRKDILELVVQNAACTKGGATNVKILDAAQFVGPLRELRQNAWLPTQTIPDLGGTADLKRVHDLLRTSLQAAIDQEAAHVEKWLAKVLGAIGEKPKIDEISRRVKEALKAASDAGVGGGMIPEVESASQALRDVDITKLLRNTSALQESDDLLGGLASLDPEGMRRLNDFVDQSENAISTTQHKIKDWLRESVGAEGKQVMKMQEQIKNDLDKVRSELTDLGGGISHARRRR